MRSRARAWYKFYRTFRPTITGIGRAYRNDGKAQSLDLFFADDRFTFLVVQVPLLNGIGGDTTTRQPPEWSPPSCQSEKLRIDRLPFFFLTVFSVAITSLLVHASSPQTINPNFFEIHDWFINRISCLLFFYLHLKLSCLWTSASHQHAYQGIPCD